MHRLTLWAAAAMLQIIVAATTSVAWAQTPIFLDDFENGMDDASIADGDRWETVTGGGGPAPNYQTENNPFPDGSLYARMFDPNGSVGPRFVTSDAQGSDGREPSIAGLVTTYSFDFWEPAELTNHNQGISFGYTAQDDLNSGERVWRGRLQNGQLFADGSNEGGTTAYPTEQLHTLWVMGNDSPLPIANYRDGQTLDPGDADVWLSINGAAPTFAFALNRQNSTQAPQGVGFRSFSADIGEVLIDNVLLMPGATFDRSAFMPPPALSLTVDPMSGQVRLQNTTMTDITFTGYSITSEAGSLNVAGWKSIAAAPTQPGFPAGDGSGNGWEKADSNAGAIAEYFLSSDSTLEAGDFISLGPVFKAGDATQDVDFEFLTLEGAIRRGDVSYAMLPAEPLPADYNGNNVVDAADLAVWKTGFGTPVGAMRSDGDGDSDGDVDGADFLLWQRQLGLTSSAEVTAVGVPEPAGWMLAVAAFWTIGFRAHYKF